MFKKITKVLKVCLAKLSFNVCANQVIGIKRQGALGDVLLITPIIKELKKRNPKALIAVETGCFEALLHHPDVDCVVSKDIEKKTSYIIDLNLAYESSPQMHLVDAYSQKALGYNLEDKRPFLYSSFKDLKNLKKILKGQLDLENDNYIVMHQAVSWENRTWPLKYWHQLVKDLLDKGFKIVIVGRKKDFSYQGDPRVVNCLSNLTLAQIRELMILAKLFIGPDSALMHIAMTTQVPIVALFTVTDPQYRVTRHTNVISVTPTSSCRFCLHDASSCVTKLACRFSTNHCLQEITPEKVFKAALKSVVLPS